MSASREQPTIPSGTVTMLFTDIEGSTQRWDRDRAAMQDAVWRHDTLVQNAISKFGGYVFKSLGDGFCTAFERADDAMAAALAIQRSVAAQDFAAIGGLRIRVAIHSGTAEERGGDYFGNTVNRVARLLGAGHGGQILVSAASAELVREALPAGSFLRDLGRHRLPDLALPEHVYQLSMPELPTDFPPIAALETHPNNLPHELTGIVGRNVEIAEIEALLAARIITITGSGGVGKTRTALHVAAKSLDQFPDGVWFVELASIDDGALVADLIAQTAGLELSSGDSLAALAAACERLRALFIFDNCEHLIAGAARVASTLLHRCTALTILTTSRQELGISGEITYRLPSLSQSDAAELFVNRARAANRHFHLSTDDELLVSEICRRLDGIPLAIELAAARMKALSVTKLQELLEERFRLLSGGSRDALPRQQTMRATIDWSYDLLSEAERALARRSSVFSGGWTLEAAEAVCTGEALQPGDIFELQMSLVEKSIAVAESEGGDPRFHLLESTRAYALEKLAETGERHRLLRRHAQWVGDFSELAYAQNWELPLERWAPPVEAEQDNIRAALAWAIGERGDPVLGATIAGALIGFWYRRPVVGIEGRRWVEAALALVDEAAHLFLVARLHFTLALISSGEKSLESARRALELFERLDDSFHIAFSYRQLAVSQLQAGKSLEALAAIRRSIEAFQHAGTTNFWPYATALAVRAAVLAALGRNDESRDEFAEALSLFSATGDEQRAAFHRQNLARLEYSCGNYDAALQELAKALDTLSHSPYQGQVALTRSALAVCKRALGKLDETTAEASEAMRLAQRSQERRAIAGGVASLAVVAAIRGRYEEATRLCGYCDNWYRVAGVAPDPIERGAMDALHAALRANEGDSRFGLTLKEGAMMSEERVAQAALLAVNGQNSGAS